MDELIIEVLSGNATPSRAEELRRWRDASPENEARFRTTRRLWWATEPARRESEPSRAAPPASILEAAERRRDAAGDAGVVPLAGRRSNRARRVGPPTWSLAAAAAVAVLALGIGLRTTRPRPEPPATFVAGAQAARTVVLDDGSLVRLAAGSSLEARSDQGERRVTLRGRAFFAVTHDESRPFVVEVDAVESRVLGTRFEVSEREDGVRTVVVEGRVAVSNDRGSVEVPAGSVASAAPGRLPTRDVPDDVYALLDWPGGILLFQGTPLGLVAREVSRRFGRTVEVSGARLPELRISGSFDDASFQDVVLALCETTGARCTLTPSGATIER